ncbi:MAG: GNAT family N-acetyltransferase [Synergistaceae bacterium]|nr:GNAT family N-acetyltransferase [Synergistaceae bacterium]
MNGGYNFYDSKHAVQPEELANLYRFTRWGRSRSVEDIARMLEGTSMCFSVRHEAHLVAFCRILTDFVYRGSLWDIMVHPDHQGKKVGTALLEYALEHPAIRNIPLLITYTSELASFLSPHGFAPREGAMMLLRRPIEYS